MSSYQDHIWKQLKSLTADELVQALERDGFLFEDRKNNILGYYNPVNKKRVTVHYHPGKTYGPNLLKALLNSAGWGIADFKRLKLVK